MTEKKGMPTPIKYLLGITITGAAIYAADKIDLTQKIENVYNGTKDAIVDFFTTDLKEAAALYQTKLKEEQFDQNRNKAIGQTMKNELQYLSGTDKLVFVEYAFKDLPEELKYPVAEMSTENLPDSIAKDIIYKMQNNGSKELNLKTSYNGLENVIGKTGNDIGNFFKKGYDNIEAKIDSIF